MTFQRAQYIYKEVEVEITADDIKRLNTGLFEINPTEAKSDIENAAMLLRKHGEIAAASRLEDIIKQEF